MSFTYGSKAKLRAADVSRRTSPGKACPLLSVISSSACPSSKGWAPGRCWRVLDRAPSQSRVFLAVSLTPVRTTNQRYLVDNGNNMQSVKISIELADNVEDYSNKGIFNDICLTSNVSVILCVPRLIKDNSCSDIDTVTEPMQCKRTAATMVADTNNFGASTKVDDDESQRLNLIDCNIYCIVMFDSIQSNQMIGETPNYCIPVKNNAITVQGISYSGPHSSSFNLNSNTASTAPRSTDKSDYAFKTSICIKKSPERMTGLAGGIVEANDEPLTFLQMLEATEREKAVRGPRNRWGDLRGLRLCGGAESSLSTAAGWGSPPAPNNSASNWGNNNNGQAGAAGNPQQQWNNGAQRPPTSQPDTGTPNSTGGNNSGGNNSPNNSTNGTLPPGSAANSVANAPNSLTSTTKIEQLNSMREALFSQDGWGGQHVNQDTNWDVPGSPEPGVKLDAPVGTAAAAAWKPVNNGTDLWEANLRNGGQPTSQPTPKTPWGHTPTTNIGGTWGEDDDAADTANMWSGPPPQQQWPSGPPQQPQHWGVAKKDDWGAWGETPIPQRIRYDAPRPDPRPVQPDPRHDHLRADMRSGGGISGRLNGDMWGQHHPNGPVPNKMMPGGVNQWGAQGPKDPAKWEEPSPPATRRTTGFDDGTSLWSGRPGVRPAQVQPVPQQGPPVQGKPDAVWGQPPRNNASWDEGHGPGWPDRETQGWPDAGTAGLGWPAQKSKQPGPGGWPDEIGEWGGPKPPQSMPGKQITKEALWSSKQFRVLVEMGYKKEEVEAALRRCEMNTEEALELLSPMRGDAWRRTDDHFAHHGGPFPHQPPPALAAVSPAVAHKMLSQPPQPPQHHHHPPYNHPNSGGGGGNGQPSATQLRMLVQQIQMAVSAGYLNHQILNQPLAPQTLVLLNQLLQQIKVLQQLLSQHQMAVTKNNSTLGVHCTVQITKAKQQISNLQNQIAAQQAIYVKQQTGGSELFNKQDPLAQLQNNLADISITKDSQPAYGASSNQQSRLNQWKLPPSLDKEGEGSEFSRAPGTAKSATSPQLNLALQSDSTWSRSSVGEAWGDSGADVSDGKDSWPTSHPTHQAVYDLVPEFEPGKPWKMKNVEDDPAMTPGSVVRSPLSLNTIKDTDMLGGAGGKSSPPAGERSLSSATWSYPPPAAPAQPLKPPADAWAANKTRVPPPGLNKSAAWPQQPHHQRNIPAWQSTWLLLKNLTAQIDGSTLKTLCMQHGPLQSFHLYLNQGIALARYSSREEANKAQTALNNCVLSNTTIFAESPGESEVQMILQHLGQGGGVGGTSAWRNPPGKEQAWGFPSLWSESHDQRSTPSSLNSFLPPDLLGGESI